MRRARERQMQRQDEKRNGSAQKAACEQRAVNWRQKIISCSSGMNHPVDPYRPKLPIFLYFFQRVTHSILPHESHGQFRFRCPGGHCLLQRLMNDKG